MAKFLRERGFTEAFRLALGGVNDAGDIGGLPDWAIECRDRSKFDLAANVRDAELRAHHKGTRFGVAVLKRRGAPTGQGYVVMTLDQFANVAAAISEERE